MRQIEALSSPLLSFAIPIRNGENTLPRLLDSLLAQDFSDFEIVISDNASTDCTFEVCQQYIQCDQRVRYHRNPENIGINANFNLLIKLARGKYMRWIGGDDYLEPDYARKCIAALLSRPDVIGVTTYQDFWDDSGKREYYEYKGRRLDYPSAYQRYERMMWFMNQDYRYIDPIYTMIRRDILLQIGGHRAVLSADQVLAVEISLRGAFTHVPECLAHRGRNFGTGLSREKFLRQNFHKDYEKVCQQTYLSTVAAYWAAVMRMPLPWWEKLLCVPTLGYCLIKATQFRLESSLKQAISPLKQALRRYGET